MVPNIGRTRNIYATSNNSSCINMCSVGNMCKFIDFTFVTNYCVTSHKSFIHNDRGMYFNIFTNSYPTIMYSNSFYPMHIVKYVETILANDTICADYRVVSDFHTRQNCRMRPDFNVFA